jgi:hypothetical protein
MDARRLRGLEAANTLRYWKDQSDCAEKRKEILEATQVLEAMIQPIRPPQRYSATRYRELWEQAEHKIIHLEKLIEFLEKDAETKERICAYYGETNIVL